jgi:hypothetical protein
VRQPDGATLREHLMKACRQTKIWPDEYREAPCPPCMALVWNWFQDLSARRTGNGYGPNPLSFTEIDTWARLSGITLTPFELQAIVALDAHYLRHRAEQDNKEG